MKKERQILYNASIEDILTEVLEYMEDRQGTDHDGCKYVPNKEMRLVFDIRQALCKLSS
jgi:hypothetical protein